MMTAQKLRPVTRNDHRRKMLKHSQKLLQRCEDLRHYVEHPNERSEIVDQGGIYREKDPTIIQSVKVDGIIVGYQVKPSSPIELNPYFDRYVYLKVPGFKLSDLTDEEMSQVKGAIYQAFFSDYQAPINLRVIAEDCLLLAQRFEVAFRFAKNKNLVTKFGGVDMKDGQIIH